jgi:type I restriction enzyme S subunit
MINLPNHQKLSSLSRNSECSGIRLKYGVELVNNRAETIFNYVGLENVESWKGKLVQSDNLSSEEDAATANRFYSENVLFGKLRPYLAKVFVAQQDGCCTSELLVLRPVKYYANYLKYLILNPDFINLVNSSTYGAKMPRASWDFIGNIFLPTPPIETQKLIATFLDSKTAAIDTLIDKKQRLIQLLEEKRTALINQSVTKGLNPNVSMKDSGIPWIGEIPEHWQICELRRKWEVIDCKHKTPEYIERGYPLVSTTEVKPRKIDLSIITRYISAKDFFDMTENRLPKKGDIIYSRNASLGSAAYVDTDELFAMGQDVVLITSKNQDQLFLSYYLNSKLGMSQVDLACVGSTFRRINVGQIRQIIITLPPINEQAEIGQYLEKATQFFSKNISIIGNQIEKLQEYRRSLITAAVTGKLNIKEVETNV